MREAFSYMFKDPGFGQKFVPFCFVNFIALLLFGAPQLTSITSSVPTVLKVTNPFWYWLPFLGGIISFALFGYATVCIKAITQKTSDIVLPFFNFKNSILRGFRFLIATLGFTLIGVFSLFILTLTQAWLLLILAIIILGGFALIYFNALFWIFANEERLSSFFAWKKATRYIKQNLKQYLNNLGIIILINLIASTLSGIIMYTMNYIFSTSHVAWIASSLTGSIISSYVAFVTIYLIAKSIKTDSVV